MTQQQSDRRYERRLYALALLIIAVWLGYSAVASAAEPVASSAARCIYIVEGDGTFVAVCAPVSR